MITYYAIGAIFRAYTWHGATYSDGRTSQTPLQLASIFSDILKSFGVYIAYFGNLSKGNDRELFWIQLLDL